MCQSALGKARVMSKLHSSEMISASISVGDNAHLHELTIFLTREGMLLRYKVDGEPHEPFTTRER